MSVCGDCGFNVRGKNHKDGQHHGMKRPESTKTQKKLWGRQNAFERDKASMGSSFKQGSMRMPGSLQVGRSR